MKKVLVFGSRDSGSKNNPSVIADGISSDVVSARVVLWEDLVFDISESSVEVFVGDQSLFDEPIDMVLCFGWYKSGKKSVYKDVAYSLAQVLQARGIKFWNSEMLQQRSTTKLSTMVQLALARISVPRTIFSLDKSKMEGLLGFPYIAKAVAASRGQSNYLISKHEDVRQYSNAEESFMLQPFIQNTYDLRVICIGDEPKLLLRRSRGPGSKSHMNNTSQGGQSEWLDMSFLDNEVLTLVKEISTISKREMAGIDLIPDHTALSGYRCLEVNAIPQLSSGFDVERKVNTFREVMKYI